jgi:hypothetical protein
LFGGIAGFARVFCVIGHVGWITHRPEFAGRFVDHIDKLLVVCRVTSPGFYLRLNKSQLRSDHAKRQCVEVLRTIGDGCEIAAPENIGRVVKL